MWLKRPFSLLIQALEKHFASVNWSNFCVNDPFRMSQRIKWPKQISRLKVFFSTFGRESCEVVIPCHPPISNATGNQLLGVHSVSANLCQVTIAWETIVPGVFVCLHCSFAGHQWHKTSGWSSVNRSYRQPWTPWTARLPSRLRLGPGRTRKSIFCSTYNTEQHGFFR